LERQLKVLGLRARSAADGEDALALWKRQAFPAIITDCHMPGLDGYALSRAVRGMEAKEGRPRTAIIAWTANVLADTTARCRAAGMDDVLTKPASLAALREVLSKWLPAGAVGPLPSGQDAMGAAQSEPIDLTQLEQVAANAEERAVILQDYMAQMRIDLADLVTAMKSTDLPASTRIAHRMKGASRTVGAHELALACEELEHATRGSDAHAAATAHAAVDRALNRVDAYVQVAAITEGRQ
jgi:CheY-like chemotaxis protein/HPt (histidine-containing phosphotransfer) domain-containing protein